LGLKGGFLMISLILLVFGFVLFVLAGLGIPAPVPPSRYNLIAFGLACWILAEIFRSAGPLLSNAPIR
jgi:cell division protein FtsW (lipid II flippase)